MSRYDALAGMVGRSADGFTLVRPYLEEALHVGLIEGKSDDGIGGHHQIIGMAVKVIDQGDHERGTRPGHQHHPAPALHAQEADQYDQARDGKQEIDSAEKERSPKRGRHERAGLPQWAIDAISEDLIANHRR